MLIEFKIQLDNDGRVSVPQAQVNANPHFPAHKQLPPAFVAPSAPAEHVVADAQKGGAQPISDLGTGAPAVASPAGHGTIVVIGPIVISGAGSGPVRTEVGGAQPLSNLGTGKPHSDAKTPDH
jgi:hypothetical protein